MKHLAILAFFLTLLIIPAYAAWGFYTVVEEITIDYTKLATTGKTWYSLSKTYTPPITIGIQPVNITFNPNAAEKKFVISIAGQLTSTYIDLAFFDTGIIDIVRTTPSGTTKLGDTSASSVRWQDIQFIIVEIEADILTLKTSNGTLLVSISDSSLTGVAQIGASGYTNAVTGGQVYVAVLTNPYKSVVGATYSVLPLMIVMLSIAIPLIFLRYILRFVNRIL